MSEQKNDVFHKPASSAPIRNPYIMNFLKTLVEKKREQHQTDDLKELLGDMYRL
jgi:predicted nuclease of restriction endonuclease-like (RecB) superfamily